MVWSPACRLNWGGNEAMSAEMKYVCVLSAGIAVCTEKERAVRNCSSAQLRGNIVHGHVGKPCSK